MITNFDGAGDTTATPAAEPTTPTTPAAPTTGAAA